MKVQNMSEETVKVQELSFSGSCKNFACVPTSWVEAACHAFQCMLPVHERSVSDPSFVDRNPSQILS